MRHFQIMYTILRTFVILVLLLSCNSGNNIKTVYTDDWTVMNNNEERFVAEQINYRKEFDTILAGYILGSDKNSVVSNEEKLLKLKLLTIKGGDTLLHIPQFPALKIGKVFFNNQLSQVHYSYDRKNSENEIEINKDITDNLFDEIENFVYVKYGDYNIYYCPKNQNDINSIWIRGDLTIKLNKYLDPNSYIQIGGKNVFNGSQVVIRYYKNSFLEAKRKSEETIKLQEQEKRYKEEQNRRDSISKFF